MRRRSAWGGVGGAVRWSSGTGGRPVLPGVTTAEDGVDGAVPQVVICFLDGTPSSDFAVILEWVVIVLSRADLVSTSC